MDLRPLLEDMKRRGIELSAIDGMLKFRAPKGALTQPDRDFLANNKSVILDFLNLREGHDSWDPPIPPSSPGPGARVALPSNPGRQPKPQKSRRPATTPSRATTQPKSTAREAGSNSQNSINSRNCSPTGNFTNYANIAMAPDPADLEELPPPAVEYGVADWMVVSIGDQAYTYSVWDGERLDGELLSLDTETELVRDHMIPGLALATVSDGKAHHLIHPDRLGEFLLLHRDKHFVFHNVAFDHWVIVEHLESRDETEVEERWWEAVGDGRVHDSMLLDGLIRLGQTGAEPSGRNLALVAGEYAGLVLDKSDPYRKRYGEIIGQDWKTVARGFFEYAIKDPIATLAAYEAMRVEAAGIMAAHGLDPVRVARQHGPLGETYQVKGAIALAAVTRLGIAVDRDQVAAVERDLRDLIGHQVAAISAIPGCDEMFARGRDGEIRWRPNGIAPSIRQGPLRRLLVLHAGRVAGEAGVGLPDARTAGGEVSIAAGHWEPFAPFDEFIRAWLKLEVAAKAYQFLARLDGPVVHPKYATLVRTGRTSCSGPNIQNMPRKGGFRESFVARPGFLLLIIDYRFIELVALAAICEARIGFSRLAEVIRAGTDPHAYTAAMLAGMEFEAFKALARSDDPGDRERYEDLRRKAKPVNFGIPGGLGAATLVAYAHANYDVVMTLDEAQRFRETLINEVYPELALYLSDDGMEALARSLGATVEACWKQLDWKGDRSGAVVGGIRNVVGGKDRKADGQAYKSRYLEGVWGGVIALNRNPELAPLLASRKGSEELRDRLFRSAVTTLTGRVRGRVSYTQARNTPFQGLAADGAKLALYELARAGYRVVAFVHDEVVIELPEDVDHAAEACRVEAIMNRSMACVTGDVPVSCEYALSRRWSKKAKACFDGDGRLVPWEDGR